MRFLLFLMAGQLAAQNSAVVSLSNGVQLRIGVSASTALKTELEPASGNSFYRVFRDQNGLVVFAYELMVSRTPDGEQFEIRGMPAGDDFATKFPNADAGKPVPTFSTPVQSPLLSSGQRFTLDIPTDPALNVDLHDIAQVQVNKRGFPAGEDGSQGTAQVRFSALRVRINGNLVTPPNAGAVVSGRYAMFYNPGNGGFFFAVDRPANRPFSQVGIVEGSHLRFTIDNITFDCDANSPILTQSDRGQLWVYHDPGYKPKGNWTASNPDDVHDEFFTASSDSLRWWLP